MHNYCCSFAVAMINETRTTRLNTPTWSLLGERNKGELGVGQPEQKRRGEGVRGACLKEEVCTCTLSPYTAL